MISIKFDDKVFFKDLMNVTQYSEGFLEGVQKGKSKFLEKIAQNGVETFKEFVDQNARVDQQMYHHIYEWYQTGNPAARLFDIKYNISESGISFNGTFSQSSSIANGSTVPFYNKAEIMEKGIPITIKPVNNKNLKFNIDGEDVFTSGPVVIERPGGTHVMGAFQNIFDIFFKEHFSQSVLNISGIRDYLSSNPAYKVGLRSAKTGGRAKGVEVGYNWITGAGDLIV